MFAKYVYACGVRFSLNILLCSGLHTEQQLRIQSRLRIQCAPILAPETKGEKEEDEEKNCVEIISENE